MGQDTNVDEPSRLLVWGLYYVSGAGGPCGELQRWAQHQVESCCATRNQRSGAWDGLHTLCREAQAAWDSFTLPHSSIPFPFPFQIP